MSQNYTEAGENCINKKYVRLNLNGYKYNEIYELHIAYYLVIEKNDYFKINAFTLTLGSTIYFSMFRLKK